jgi:hypothetical protein
MRRIDDIKQKQRDMRLRLLRIASRVEAVFASRAPISRDEDAAYASATGLHKFLVSDSGLRERLERITSIQRTREATSASTALPRLHPDDLRQLGERLDEHATSIEEILTLVRRHANFTDQIERRLREGDGTLS